MTEQEWLDRRDRLIRRLDRAGWEQITGARWLDPAGTTRILVPNHHDALGAGRLLIKAEADWSAWLAAERAEIDAQLRRLIAAGGPFSVDDLWDLMPLKVAAFHRYWLGGTMMRLNEAQEIRFVQHVDRPRAAKHSRTVKQWQATPVGKANAQRRVAA